MLIVTGFPAMNVRWGRAVGEGTLFVKLGEWVGSLYTLGDTAIDNVTMNGLPLPREAEVWFQSVKERDH